MGYQLAREAFSEIFESIKKKYDIWAPVRKEGEGTFSEIDVIRYDKIEDLDEIEWEKRSDYSFKESLLKIRETIFYFTEDETIVPKEQEKDLLIFLRSCEMHALKRLDEMYLKSGREDFYYARMRKKAKFILMGCKESCETGFCVSMGTNKSENYDAYLKLENNRVCLDVSDEELKKYFKGAPEAEVLPEFVQANLEKVELPKHLSKESAKLPIWEEYGARCIGCGRCNFVCPTCTCFTMQDIFYKDNEKAGERRRVWASCQVDKYDTIAGGHEFRTKKADKVRFKVLHKIYHYEKRFGYPMCVGCGRCDSVCPEYISYSNLINRLSKEEKRNEE